MPFSKPKRHVAARAVAQAQTGEEILGVAKGLTEKYPQMQKSGWGKPQRGKAVAGKKTETVRTKAVSRMGAQAGLTEGELNRLKGRK